MDSWQFEFRIQCVNVALKAMQEAAESDGRDISATIIALEQERDLVIRNFYGMRDGPQPPDEPPGGALSGARIKPTPPARPGVDAKPFPPENDTAEA